MPPSLPSSPTSPSGLPYTIRAALPRDAASVSKLIGETWAKFFAYSVTEQDLKDYLASRLSESKIKEEIENEKNTFLVAVFTPGGQEEEIKAVVHLVQDSSEPCLTLSRPIELQRLYVHPSEHGSGLSHSLVAAAEQASRALGAESIWLGVWEDNARGKRFYEKAGFSEVGEHFFWVGDSKRRDLIMEKAL
ncbi:hypothetical protein I350_05924 [Cryptococcus amylolentus CBS 6273]|uniref:N-acetyltransferase domain-containing protein n=1 Tax=Cryptococcus amylolentus CBS 6273 TaxID=1296118 RepID=A0A1E3JQB9_9TREE|nr:hypothetical protein I350_05924 [Cryptococcus amylolentus CBS 6273]